MRLSVIWTMFLLSVTAVFITLLLALWSVSVCADRKPETPEEAQAASMELSRLSDSYGMDYWEAEQHDGKWEARFVRLEGKSGRIVWEEIGYSHLMDTLEPIENDVKNYPNGHSGHSSE